MFPGQPSRTLLRSAIRRAAHQLRDNPRILNDPIVVGLVPEAFDPAIVDTLDDAGGQSRRDGLSGRPNMNSMGMMFTGLH